MEDFKQETEGDGAATIDLVHITANHTPGALAAWAAAGSPSGGLVH